MSQASPVLGLLGGAGNRWELFILAGLAYPTPGWAVSSPCALSTEPSQPAGCLPATSAS